VQVNAREIGRSQVFIKAQLTDSMIVPMKAAPACPRGDPVSYETQTAAPEHPVGLLVGSLATSGENCGSLKEHGIV
jgi:hypothetical protein